MLLVLFTVVFLSCRRYIFNWAHRSVGLSSLILAGKTPFEFFFVYRTDLSRDFEVFV